MKSCGSSRECEHGKDAA